MASGIRNKPKPYVFILECLKFHKALQVVTSKMWAGAQVSFACGFITYIIIVCNSLL